MSQTYPYVDAPLVGATAFSQIGEQHSGAQAAILLLLGQQIRGDGAATIARAKSAAQRHGFRLTGVPPSEFPVPHLKPPITEGAALRRTSSARIASVRKRFGPAALTTRFDKAVLDSAADVYKSASMESAANLLELCLAHPVPLVRIAAASAYFPLSTEPQRLIAILAAGVSSHDDLERGVAATALARIEPTHPSLAALLKPRRSPPGGRRGQTLVIVHGTWASGGKWWQYGGDFHKFMTGRRADTYGAPDRFRWSGGYSDGARAKAAADLEKWVRVGGHLGLDLVGHSHGANAMMLATANGMRAGKLVLLSCPVHVEKYYPDFAKCKEVHSVRVKMDLVILADRGGQRFRDPRIREHVLPIWFDHGASHDRGVWTKHKVAQRVGL